MTSSKGFFIIGTDTGVGKTLVATSLLSGLKTRCYCTIGLKPIASGAQSTIEGLRNEDALSLQNAASIRLQYDQVNPFCFAEAIAPHIAATRANCSLTVSTILEACRPSLTIPVDYRIVEGVGGVCVPLNEKELFTDLVRGMGFPCILVVGLRLGCLNQALLSWKYLQQCNLPVIGWIANQVDSVMECVIENVEFLKASLPIPCLGFFPYFKQINLSDFSSLIDYKALLDGG
ncbi:MAG: dethiobiotin synthase [Rickettsiella sp.]|nr:dethiobiotin synthase [Rickettsiella sp.]